MQVLNPLKISDDIINICLPQNLYQTHTDPNRDEDKQLGT